MHRHLSFAFFLVCCSACMLASASRAQDAVERQQRSPQQVYRDVSRIPDVLLSEFKTRQTEDAYASQHLGFVEQHAQDKHSLKESDIARVVETAIQKALEEQNRELTAFDQNADGSVTAEEIKATLADKYVAQSRGSPPDPVYLNTAVERRYGRYMKADANRDGVISPDEMAGLPPSAIKDIRENKADRIRGYLKLDTDGNGSLDVIEMERLARKAFGLVDADGDDRISFEELKVVNKIKGERRHVSKCGVPAIPPGMEYFYISLPTGDTISSVAVETQFAMTTVVDVEISDNSDPFVLALLSGGPVIWRFSGKTSALARVVLMASTTYGGRGTSSAVMGLRPEQVLFPQASCYGDYMKLQPVAGKRSDYAPKWRVGQIKIGNLPRLVVNHPRGGTIMERDMSYVSLQPNKEAKPAPEGLDFNLWFKVLENFSGGLAFLRPEEIMYHGKLETYEILPHMAGIAQLVHAKALEYVQDDVYRVVKNIPRYPAGFGRSKNMMFLLAPGVEPPTHRPARACVIREATHEIVEGKQFCPGVEQ